MQPTSTLQTLVKRILRPVYHPPRAVYQYFRARNIVRDYATNYGASRRVYAQASGPDERVIPSLKRLGVRVVNPVAEGALFRLPPEYPDLVRRVAQDVDRRFERSANCLFMPSIERQGLPEHTREIPAVREGQVISLQLRDALSLDGLHALSQAVLPELERRLFGCFVIVDKVYVYRNLVTRQQEQVSWLWHYDNHPTEVVKVMIYLTDVTERSAPFEYVRRTGDLEALVFSPLPLLGHSRISAAALEHYLSNGHEAIKAIGPRGTMVVFDDNVLHRATFAREGHRDALVFQIRPASFRPEARLDPRWSGSFQHDDFNRNPDDYSVRVKRRRHSG